MADHEVDLIRDIGWNRAKNRFYRICYTMLKELQEIVERTTDDLLLVYHSESPSAEDSVKASGPLKKVLSDQMVKIMSNELQDMAKRRTDDLSFRYYSEYLYTKGSPYQHVADIAARLKEELDRFSAREAAASNAWNELWDHPSTK